MPRVTVGAMLVLLGGCVLDTVIEPVEEGVATATTGDGNEVSTSIDPVTTEASTTDGATTAEPTVTGGDGGCTPACPDAEECVAGECVAVGDCGDGVVSGAESCDDANLDPGDGCAADCTWERQCVLALRDGNPATLQVLRIDADGSLYADAPTVDLPSGHNGLAIGTDNDALIRCRGRSFALMNLTGEIVAIDVGEEGEPILGPVTTVVADRITSPKPFGIACMEDASLIVTVAQQYNMIADEWSLRVTTWSVAADGSLVDPNALDVGTDPVQVNMAWPVAHPSIAGFWIVADYSPALTLVRLSVSDEGMPIEENRVEFSQIAELAQVGVAMEPPHFVLAGALTDDYTTLAFELDPAGNLPEYSDAKFIDNPAHRAWRVSRTMATATMLTDGRALVMGGFYEMGLARPHDDGLQQIGEFPIKIGGTQSVNTIHDGRVLVAITSLQALTYATDQELPRDTAEAELSRLPLPNGLAVQASVAVPCPG